MPLLMNRSSGNKDKFYLSFENLIQFYGKYEYCVFNATDRCSDTDSILDFVKMSELCMFGRDSHQ